MTLSPELASKLESLLQKVEVLESKVNDLETSNQKLRASLLVAWNLIDTHDYTIRVNAETISELRREGR